MNYNYKGIPGPSQRRKRWCCKLTQPASGPARVEGCPAEKGNTMANERVTRRQKDISRLLREQKKTGKPKPLRPQKKK
jgi:hypothetical protein